MHLLQSVCDMLLVLEDSVQGGCHVLVEQAALDLAGLHSLFVLRLQEQAGSQERTSKMHATKDNRGLEMPPSLLTSCFSHAPVP